MAAQTRQKKSTVSNSVKSFQSISDVLKPACELNSSEMIHFKRVVNSREADSWSEHDLSIATQLAKTMRRFEDLQSQLDSEGLTLVNERGTTIAHPLLNASMGMSSSIQSLSRTLGLSASQKGLSGAPQASRNKADQDARKVIERAAADDLLA